jgi:hypothetical protein
MNEQLMLFLGYLLSRNDHVVITSAKRTPSQNLSAGGASNSQHLFGEAIDFKPYGSTTYCELLTDIHFYADQFHPFDQLILYPSFIHISFGSRNRLQVIDKRKCK